MQLDGRLRPAFTRVNPKKPSHRLRRGRLRVALVDPRQILQRFECHIVTFFCLKT